MATRNAEALAAAEKSYEWGFSSDIEQEFAPKGLNEDTVRFISAKKNEPEWMLDWRLKAFRLWQTMEAPDWAKLDVPPIDYQDAYYYAAPKVKPTIASLDELDPEILRTYQKLGIPIEEQKVLAGVEGARKIAVDAVFDSVSVATTFRKELEAAGVIFRSISEAIREYPDQVRKWLGKVVPMHDNYFATLNCAVFSDGTFVYIPKGVRCPMELSTYFRINAENTGQFERTLIVAEAGSYVSYLEGCTAPMRDENQLHAAVVELVAMDDAEIKYSTVQNWYPGDAEGKGGIYNFVTKRALCQGKRSKVSWTQVETGSAITWKYPSCVLAGEDSVGEFYSVAVTNNRQQADTGTKMIHLGKGSRSTIVSKGISAGRSDNTYRGLVRVGPTAENVRNFTQCDSLLLGDQCGAHTVPYIEVRNPTAQIEHEATTSKISDDQLFYAMSRGLDQEAAVALIVNGCRWNSPSRRRNCSGSASREASADAGRRSGPAGRRRPAGRCRAGNHRAGAQVAQAAARPHHPPRSFRRLHRQGVERRCGDRRHRLRRRPLLRDRPDQSDRRSDGLHQRRHCRDHRAAKGPRRRNRCSILKTSTPKSTASRSSRGSISRSIRVRSMRSWGRTAPASRRCPMFSPAGPAMR
jgi:Fe-S cluster assembly protein SufB